MTYIQDTLGPNSNLAKQLENYEPRPGQIKMAEAINDAISNKQHIAIEAPTGTGKSMAYLIPAIYHAVHEHKKIVVVTENIVLQEQLITKDLPFVKTVLPWKFDFALLKGRNNYVCMSKTENVVNPVFDGSLPYSKDNFLDVKHWAENTETGDRSELIFEPHSLLWSLFSTMSDDCRKKECRYYDSCFYNQAKKLIASADVIVTNYHLLFANIKCGGRILPEHDIVILDEAHNIADIARDFFGWKVSYYAIRNALNKWDGTKAQTIKPFFAYLAKYMDLPGYRCRIMDSDHLKRYVDASTLLINLEEAKKYYRAKVRDLENAYSYDKREELADFQNLADRCVTYIKNIKMGMELSDTNVVCYIEKDKKGSGILCSKPINVSEMLNTSFFSIADVVILTSATITADNSFKFIRKQIGCLDDTLELIIESPFNFYEQCAGIAVGDLPDPNSFNYPEAVAEAIEKVVQATDGRCLGLFTSNKVLNRTYEQIVGNGHTVYRQGDMPKTKLIEAFKRDVKSVLLGTNSFWAGVDIPGESLSCVIIDKIPFQQLSDPVLNAIQASDSNSFWNYQVPKAIIRFKQGFGRLIRRTSDRGIVVILDPRIHTKSYGVSFQASLPRMQWGNEISDIENVKHLITSKSIKENL